MANYNLFDAASLAMVPVGYKAGKLYSVKPDTGAGDFDFSRASSATRVNADGLIEKETQNQLLQSNTFSNGIWSKADGNLTSGQTGYDGLSDAWKYTTTSTAGSIYQFNTYSGVQTFSVYVKGNGSTGLRMYVFGSVNQTAWFNLNTGEVVSDNSIKAEIQDIGGGWYRCSIVVNQTNTQVRLYTTNAAATTNSAGTIYIQDAQLEQGLVATEYIETTTAPIYKGVTDNIPRIDYTSGCGSLLLEPSRTNLLPHSEYFGASDWVKLGAGTGDVPIITKNYAISPEGVQNATRIQLNLNGGTGSSSNQSLFYDDLGAKTGDYTRSVYIKSLTTDTDLYFGGTLNDRKIITATTEWQRFDFKSTLSAQSLYVTIGLRGTTGSSDTADILVWGFQAEAGSYPTSYIPTYGSSVTRVDESSSLTGASSIIGQTQGTIFVEYDFDATRYNNGGSDNDIIHLRNSSNDLIKIVHYGTGSGNAYKKVYLYQQKNSQYEVSIASPVQSTGRMKVAAVYRENYYALYLNGVKIGENLNAGVPNLDLIYLNKNTGFVQVTNTMHQAVLFPTALTDTELAALTTL
jgi:hypothetical protein